MPVTILENEEVKNKMADDKVKRVTKKGYLVKYGFNNDFVDLIDELREKYGEKIFEIHGIGTKNLDITQFPKNFYNKSTKAVASVSIDDNANVSAKDISQYTYERFKPQQKLNSIYLIYKWVKKFFSKKDARIAIERIISGDIFLNDLTDVEKPYCFAIDLNNLLVDGMNFYDGKNIKIGIPTRSDSFIQQVIQTTAFISNQIMGAIAYPSFFPILDKFYRAEYGEDYMQRYESDKEMQYKITNQFQNLIYSFNFPFRGNQSSFTNLSVLDKEFAKALFDGFVFADDGTEPNIDSFVGLSKKFFEYFVDINNKEGVFTFPVMTLAVSLDENNNYKDESIIDWISEVNHEKSIGNIFQSKPNSFCSCCRLKNELDVVNEINSYGKINSFGASSGLSVGSHRVCGINLPRLAVKERENTNQLNEIMDSIHKILYAHRMLIKERIELGVLPLYTTGWMDLARQYSTVGLIGGYEYVKNKGLSILTQEGTDALMNVMKTVEGKILEYQKNEKGCIYNIESIPGESQAVKLCDIDKILGYCDPKTKLYSNQYVSLMDECSIYDRMKTQGIFDSVTSGGAIMHCTYKDSTPLTKEQYRAIVEMAKELHNEYFAINYAYVKCANGHRSIGEKDVCDVCGAPIVARFQRVVGFITCVESWNNVRREYEYKRRTSVKVEDNAHS